MAAAKSRAAEPRDIEPTAAEPRDIEQEDVVRLRAVIARLSRQLKAQPSDFGLSPSEFSALASVVRHGPLGVGELAEMEGINPTMLSRIVGKLADEGLVAREQRPNDRRAVLVTPTADGRRLHERIKARRAQLLTDGLRQLPAASVRDVVDALPALEHLAFELKQRANRGSRTDSP